MSLFPPYHIHDIGAWIKNKVTTKDLLNRHHLYGYIHIYHTMYICRGYFMGVSDATWYISWWYIVFKYSSSVYHLVVYATYVGATMASCHIYIFHCIISRYIIQWIWPSYISWDRLLGAGCNNGAFHGMLSGMNTATISSQKNNTYYNWCWLIYLMMPSCVWKQLLRPNLMAPSDICDWLNRTCLIVLFHMNTWSGMTFSSHRCEQHKAMFLGTVSYVWMTQVSHCAISRVHFTQCMSGGSISWI